MKPEYTQILTPAERAAAMRLGAVMKFAAFGVRPSQIDGLVKSGAIDISPGNVAKALIAVSLIAGIPLGAASHVIGKRITEQKAKERELKEKIKDYREATRGLESGLAGARAHI
jgi:hypothetical protein